MDKLLYQQPKQPLKSEDFFVTKSLTFWSSGEWVSAVVEAMIYN